MKQLLSYLPLLLVIFCFGQQEEVKTEIKAENVFELSIIQIFPDSFPYVSVAFQAKNKFGKPLWTLDKSEIKITENEKKCEVLGLKNISNNKPLNIGIVFDHSASMIDNPTQMPKDQETMQHIYFSDSPLPKDYVMAIEYEKKGVLNFLKETTLTKDSVLFVGFSDVVDKIYPLTNDFKKIKSFVNKVQPSGNTAFYDALYLAIDSLSKHNSKGVIVALTDGNDNSSEHDFTDVILHATNNNISIYTIGLGGVNGLILEQIARLTKGFYYHTNEPEKLEEIYLNIKEQLKSIYQVDYKSISQNYLENDRQIEFYLTNDTLTFSNNSSLYSLPDETIKYLKEQEEIRLKKLKTKRLYPAGIIVLFVSIGGFLVFRRKKKITLEITNAYPNPFQNEIRLAFKASIEEHYLELTISSINGTSVRKIQIDSGVNPVTLNLSELKNGTYLFQLSNTTSTSNSIKVVKA